MAAKNSGRGLSSSAGLVTYYDADDKKAVHIKPTIVLVVTGLIGVVIYMLNLFF
ncbi:MAG TPA: preprotein translocase subunit Sec61beta [Methanocorpusculum sp.]|nr:preprotein translocase subunit Sec61beta [Methanocorpusculum sp.]HJJ53045.1 preprotein translocase subunit Sec61beta [Methanocorpusculum sp.]